MLELGCENATVDKNGLIQTEIRLYFVLYQIVLNQMDVRLDPIQSENGKCNLISGWFNKISKIFLCVYGQHTDGIYLH